jgi:hypothetical protein
VQRAHVVRRAVTRDLVASCCSCCLRRVEAAAKIINTKFTAAACTGYYY